jgi:hypothetical protein
MVINLYVFAFANRAEALPMFPSTNARSIAQIPDFEYAWRIGGDVVAVV